jgi:hypothetical protein
MYPLKTAIQKRKGLKEHIVNCEFIFYSFQSRKFIFKPDRLNGFDVQSEVDALQDRQQELVSNINGSGRSGRIEFPKTPRK